MISSSQQVVIIARYTFVEMLKSKMLWNVAVLGLFIAITTFIATEFTYGVPIRVAIDLGLASLSLSGYAIALLIGLGLVRHETDSRTVYLIISRPVSRTSFLVGKVLGLSLFVALNLIILGFITIAMVVTLGGTISAMFVTALGFSILEAILLLSLVVLISLLANQAITLMSAVILLVGGHALGETLKSSFVEGRVWLKEVIEFFDLVLPGFYRFNFKDHVLYQVSVPFSQIAQVSAYGVLYTVALVMLSAWVLNRKNLD